MFGGICDARLSSKGVVYEYSTELCGMSASYGILIAALAGTNTKQAFHMNARNVSRAPWKCWIAMDISSEILVGL